MDDDVRYKTRVKVIISLYFYPLREKDMNI